MKIPDWLLQQSTATSYVPAPLDTAAARPDLVRPDKTLKGPGFLGSLDYPGGGTSTELSIGVPINGKQMDIPSLVPGLTQEEIHTILNVEDPKLWPQSIIDKAVNHAKKRLAEGKSVFAEPWESPQQPQHFAAGGKVMFKYDNGKLSDNKGFKFNINKARVDHQNALTRDTVPAMLSPGEFVMRPEAVQAVGIPQLQHMNALMPQHFATGGFVNNTTDPSKPWGAMDTSTLAPQNPAASGYDVYDPNNTRMQFTQAGGVSNVWDPNYNVNTGTWKTGAPTGTPTPWQPSATATSKMGTPDQQAVAASRVGTADYYKPFIGNTTTSPVSTNAPPAPPANGAVPPPPPARDGGTGQSVSQNTPTATAPIRGGVAGAPQATPPPPAGTATPPPAGTPPAGTPGAATPPVGNTHPNQLTQVPSTIAQGAYSPYDPSTWGNDPWYQWQKQQGTQQLGDYLGSLGRTNSTYGINSMSDMLRGLNAAESQNLYNRWFGEDQAQYQRQLALTQLGYGAANQAGQMALNQGNLYGQYFNQAGQLQAQGVQTLANQLSQMGLDYATALNVANGEYGSTIMQMLLNQGYAGAQNSWNLGNPTAGLNYMGGYNNAGTAQTAGNSLSQIIQTAVNKSKQPTTTPAGTGQNTGDF